MRDYDYREKRHKLLTSEIVKNSLLFTNIGESSGYLLKLIKMNFKKMETYKNY